MLKITAFDSAYPGSIFSRPDGGYVLRDDPTSLANSLLALIESGDRAAENANAALAEAQAHIKALEETCFDMNNRLHANSDLAESQAREAQLRAALQYIANEKNTRKMICDPVTEFKHVAARALALPTDDTALKAYGAKVLRVAADDYAEGMFSTTGKHVADTLRRMADELEVKP